MKTSRAWTFVISTVLILIVAVGYVVWAIVRPEAAGQNLLTGPISIGPTESLPTLVAADGATLMFQNLVPGDYWGRVGLIQADHLDGSRRMAPLRCARVYFGGDRGICLTGADALSASKAFLFDSDYHIRSRISLSGLPSRARISRDGRFAAVTVFVSGHSYAEDGFSTATTLIDIERGAEIANLESFAVKRDGRVIKAADFNFWGVTFSQDSNVFYATVATKGKTYLAEGDIRAREVKILRENVECPSVSPDGTRVAFKKRISDGVNGVVWRFAILDLRTFTETLLSETRSVDDQLEWADDQQLLYGYDSDLWSIRADGTGEPSRVMSKALSPSVIKGASFHSTTDAVGITAADLAVTVTGSSKAQVQREATYRIEVKNNGPAPVGEVIIEQPLPEWVALRGMKTIGTGSSYYGCWTVSEPGQPAMRGGLRCQRTGLVAGATWTVEVTVSATKANVLPIAVSVRSGAETDPISGNNQAKSELSFTN